MARVQTGFRHWDWLPKKAMILSSTNIEEQAYDILFSKLINEKIEA